MMDYDTTTSTSSSTSFKTTPVVNQPQHYEAFTPATSLRELILKNTDGECDYFNSSCTSMSLLSYDEEVEQSNFDGEEELTDCGGWMQYMTLLFIGTFFCYGLQLVKRMNSIRFTLTTTTAVNSNASRKQQKKKNAPIKPQQQQQQQQSSSSSPRRTIQDVVVQQTANAASQQQQQQQQRNSWGGLPSLLSFHFRVLMIWIVASAVTNACKCC